MAVDMVGGINSTQLGSEQPSWLTPQDMCCCQHHSSCTYNFIICKLLSKCLQKMVCCQMSAHGDWWSPHCMKAFCYNLINLMTTNWILTYVWPCSYTPGLSSNTPDLCPHYEEVSLFVKCFIPFANHFLPFGYHYLMLATFLTAIADYSLPS